MSTPEIEARLKPLAKEARALVHCRACGRYLWTIEELGRPELLETLTLGWRYDVDSETWRVTDRLQSQLLDARERTRKGIPRKEDQMLLTHARRYPLPPARETISGSWMAGHDILAALTLPTKISCPDCNTINRVAKPG